MKLVIGGYAQGKLDYILKESNQEHYVIFDSKVPNAEQLQEIARQGKTVVINHFHHWGKERISQGENMEEEIFAFLEKSPKCVIISDEIGNGIVPVNALEREYRERVGRILVKLAGQADEVVRVICGIGQKIK